MPSIEPSDLSLLEWTLLANYGGTTEVVLVRHGQQGPNSLHDPARDRGGDAPLSDVGLRQAQLVADALLDRPIDRVFSSGLLRAHQTAAVIAQRHGVEPIIVDGLHEVGVYQDVPSGQTVLDTIGQSALDDVAAAFVRTRSWDVFPLSESSQDFRGRTSQAVDRILSADGSAPARVVIVCHGGVINAQVADVLGLKHCDMLFYPAHASITRIAVFEDRRVIHSLNETHYLRAESDDLVTF